MPSIKEHKLQSVRNEAFYNEVSDAYQDWALTGLFYSALHLVDAFLCTKNVSVENHLTRFDYMNKIKELKPLYADYKILYDYSINARYKMHKFSSENITDTYKTVFKPFKKNISKYL